MQWIDENGLATWSKRNDAQALLVDLVADLIRASIPDTNRYRFRFPGGDVGQVRGWDGDLETAEAVGYIPAGKSKWEFGVGAGQAKASSDYKTRTGETTPEFRAENTLVLVNLGVWDTPRVKLAEWEDERKAEGVWRDVKYIDAVTLVHWLDEHPAVAAKYARDVLACAPKEGALSTDEYWDEFSSQFSPRLSEKVVIGDRKEAAESLLEKLLAPAGLSMIGAETEEEVVAFAVAAIRSAEANKRKQLESRTLIVRNEPAARELSNRSGLIFIAIEGAGRLAGRLSDNCATLSAVTGASANKHPPLERPSASGMAEGFIEMGLEREQGYELAQRCGRSLTILKRLIPHGPNADPVWLPQATNLKAAFLAGGWSSDTPMDCELLSELGGYESYPSLESVLMPTLVLSDRPIDRVAGVWKVRAPVDAFYFYGARLTQEDLSRFHDAVVKVFSHETPVPSREEKFSFTYLHAADYSTWLRDGLALTLVIIATMHDVAELHIAGKSAQQYINEIVEALPEWGKTHNSIIRLGDQTALIAEAAPNPFLMALESMLEGSPDDLVKIFVEDDAFFGPSSPHIDILWALETIAWDPRYLNRAALVLAKLAELDPNPKSNHVNRPINSLREILLSWSPNTYAPQAQRIACVDGILAVCPAVGWNLLVRLLPSNHSFSSSTRRPKIRDIAPKVSEEITFGSVWNFEAAIVGRALLAAGNDEERIMVLIRSFGNFQPDNRASLLAHVDDYLKTHQTPEGCKVWQSLEGEVTRHSYFSDSDWAMPPKERDAITEVVERYRPTDPLVTERRVFDDWVPQIGKYQSQGGSSDNSDELRGETLERIFNRDGVSGILRLARMVKLPHLIGPALRHTSISMPQMFELLQGTLDHEHSREVSFFISAVGAEKFGDQWKEAFAERVREHVRDDSTMAYLLLGWAQDETTWSLVESLGEQVWEEYWIQTNSLPIHGTLKNLQFAINQLCQRKRDIDVLSLVHRRIKDLPTDQVQDILINGISQVNQAVKRMGTMLTYYVAQALEELRNRSDIEKLEIAKIEFAYLPVLRFEDQPLTIIELMSHDPELFVEVLSNVFRGEHAAPEELVTDEMKASANTSFDLLRKFKTVPGVKDLQVDLDVLAAWVSQARCVAESKDLTKICDIHIGHLLAHAPNDPSESFWPSSAVCKVIEATSSTDLELGFTTECFNKRGVYHKAIFEGGKQEKQLAEQYLWWSEATHQYPRTSLILASIAERWNQQASDEDKRAEQDKMKM